MRARFLIDAAWDGSPVPAGESAVVELSLEGSGLRVEIDAPFHGDPPPPGPPGRTEKLWEHEAVELFLQGEGERYIELEFGPHGHHLALAFDGERRLVRDRIELDFEASLHGDRWRGRARVPANALPPGLRRGNSCAVHGAGPARKFLSACALPGEVPDFHRLERFRPL